MNRDELVHYISNIRNIVNLFIEHKKELEGENKL